MKGEVKEGRRTLEEELRKLVGNIFVPEAKVFGMACGCVGFAADLRGLRSDDVEVFTEKINSILGAISESVGVEPEGTLQHDRDALLYSPPRISILPVIDLA